MSDTGQIIQIAGTIASIYTGNPAWALAANAVATAYFPPEGPGIEGPRLNDLKSQSSTYGSPIPIVYGRARLAGTLIWIKDNKLIEVRTVTEEGGKGGGGATQEVTTYQYFGSFAVAICEGEITGIRKIWADNVLIYDISDGQSVMSVLGTQQISDRITAYTGTATQEPDSLIEADVTTAPAYRGVAYVVFDQLPLEKYGNRLPNMTFEVVDGTASSDLLSSFTTTTKGDSSHFEQIDTHFLDASGRGYIIMPQYGNSYSTNNHKGSLVYPDGRQEISGNVNIGQRYGFTPDTPGSNEGDIPFVCRMLSATSDSFQVHVYNHETGAMPETGYYDTTLGTGLLAVSCVATIRGSYITLFNPYPTNAYQIHVAPYPYGSSSAYRDMQELANSADLTGEIKEHTHDGVLYCYITTTSNKIYTYNMDTLAQTNSASIARAYRQIRYDTTTSKLYGEASGNFYEIDPTTGTETLVVATGLGATAAYSWDIRGDLLHTISTTSGTTATRRYYAFNSLTPNEVNLSAIISDLCTRSGLTAGEIDVTGISDTVKGFVHTKPAAAASDLQTLALSYNFDAVESGYKIKFVSRGGASAVTLTNDDLAAHEYGQERPDELIQVRERDVAIPYRVETSFIDTDRDYDPGTQYAERLVTSAVGIQRLQLAILLTTAEAAAIAEILLWRRWLERHTYEFQLPYKYSYLEPTDILTMNLDEGTFTLRLTETSIGAPGLMKCKAVQELPEIYTSAATGESGVATTQTVDFLVDTHLNFLDTAILRDADDDAGYYYAAGPDLGSTWDGCVLLQSNDSGESYFRIDAAIEESVQGVCTTTLADGEHLVFDRVNTVTVQLRNVQNTLSSATEINVLNGSNLCAIGADGRWEILKFANATLGDPGEYTLDTFIRGYRGTEQHMGTHTSSDKFILLTAATTQRYNPGADFIGNSRLYKPVTFGRTLIGTDSQTFQNNAIGLKPYAPVNIKGSRDGSNNLTITWNRRTRVSGEWRDIVDVPLGETSESYEIDIITAGSPDVVRTITASSETASYTAAQQTTDFGATQSSVQVNIYQLSSVFGRGYAGNATI